MKPPLEQNYYELLEVPRDATVAEIDRAYDRARAYYGAGSTAVYSLVSTDEVKLVQDRIDEAYLVLADEKARAEYDARTPPAPDERPLHREVRLAREREAQRQSTPGPMRSVTVQEVEQQEATARGDKPEPKAEVKPEPRPEPKAEVKPEPAAEVLPPEPIAAPAPAASEPAIPVVASAEVAAPRVAAPEPAVVPAPPAAKPAPAPEPPAPAAGGARQKPELAADAVFTGEFLRRLREGQGLTLQEMADHTKIGKSHLDNIEADRHAALPAQVYLRGFLMSYARELRLDPLRVSKSYLEQMAANPRTKPGLKTRS
jgi:hypothetical protein